MNSAVETRLPRTNACLSDCIDNQSKLSLRVTMQNRFLSSRIALRNDWLWAWGVIAVSQNCIEHQFIKRLRRDCPSKAYGNEINSEAVAWLSRINVFYQNWKYIFTYVGIDTCIYIYIYMLNAYRSWASDMTVQKRYYSSRFASRSDQLWALGVIVFL